jgi:hypothetical protein
LWIDVITDILNFVIDWSGRAPNGELRGKIKVDLLADGNINANAAGVSEDVIDRHIDVDFPPILQQDIAERMAAVVSAVTLNGQPAAGTLPDQRFVAKLMLQILGQNDIDELLDQMFPEDAEAPTQEGQRLMAAIEKLCEAVKALPEPKAA